MDRCELGERLLQWHSGQNDPIYAVGSFYFEDDVYPNKQIVQDALHNLNQDLSQFQRMLAGEKVMVSRSGKLVDLKVFAGYTRAEMQDHVTDLTEVVSELESFQSEDYTLPDKEG